MIFDILSRESIKKIVEIQVGEVVKRLVDKNIDLILTPAVYDYLAKEGYNPQYGARPLKRLIQNKILTPVANLLIAEEVTKGGRITVDYKADKFSFEVKKKQKGSNHMVMQEMVGQGK
jgi:ATP-dependent Clp protease ATP-binding subunit ClpA